MAEKFKSELLLEENNFHLMEQYTDKFALAKVIQNILIMEKGTYPNQPELGVGIEDWLFEFLSNEKAMELNNIIKQQISRFIPTTYDVNLTIQSKDITSSMKGLLLKFTFVDEEENEATTIGFLFGRSQKTKKVLSKIIV